MQAGLLTEDITIQRATIVKNAYGSQVTTWADVEVCKAKADYITGGSGRGENNQEIKYNTIYLFETYFHVDVKPYDRVIYNEQAYNVIFIQPLRLQNKKIIKCEIIDD